MALAYNAWSSSLLSVERIEMLLVYKMLKCRRWERWKCSRRVKEAVCRRLLDDALGIECWMKLGRRYREAQQVCLSFIYLVERKPRDCVEAVNIHSSCLLRAAFVLTQEQSPFRQSTSPDVNRCMAVGCLLLLLRDLPDACARLLDAHLHGPRDITRRRGADMYVSRHRYMLVRAAVVVMCGAAGRC